MYVKTYNTDFCWTIVQLLSFARNASWILISSDVKFFEHSIVLLGGGRGWVCGCGPRRHLSVQSAAGRAVCPMNNVVRPAVLEIDCFSCKARSCLFSVLFQDLPWTSSCAVDSFTSDALSDHLRELHEEVYLIRGVVVCADIPEWATYYSVRSTEQNWQKRSPLE